MTDNPNPPFPRLLFWMDDNWNREIKFIDKGDEIGRVEFKLFSSIIKASILEDDYEFHLSFFRNTIKVFKMKTNQEIAHIKLSFFMANADIVLHNGEKYKWRRKDFFMRNWLILHDLPNTDNDPICIEYYRTREWLTQLGLVQTKDEAQPNNLLSLIGIVIGIIFLNKRRRRAAG